MNFNLNDEVKKVEKDIINWRHELHKIPEVGYDLHKTVAYICKQLDDMSIPYTTMCDDSAVVGLINPGKERCLALRADIDALPIQEETGFEFASTHPGKMHACGHDFHTASLLGTAKILKGHEDKLTGTIKLIFQCNEEGLCGAKRMLEEGVLQNPKVDSIIGMHVASIDALPAGAIAYSTGPAMASSDKFSIKLIGQGAHGSTPHQAIDPISMACRVVQELHTMRAMEIDTLTPAVITVGTLRAGNGAFNVIPGSAEIIGTVRTFDNSLRPHIKERMEQIVKSVVESHNGSYEFQYDFLCPALCPSLKETENLVASAKKCVDEKLIIRFPSPIMGSEDFAEYLQNIPGTFFYLNAPEKIDGICYPAHSSKFALGENYFSIAANVIAQYVFDYFKNENTK